MKRFFLVGLAGSLLAAIIALEGCNVYDIPKNACSKQVSSSVLNQVDQTQLQRDIALIEKYLTDNSITATKDPSGLYYQITKTGDAARPCLEKAILVKYTGKIMATGTVFDSSSDGVAFQLNTLIVGWQLGLLKVGRESSITLYVPSVYAYGKDGFGTRIPANSNLIFEIELVDLQE